MTLMTVEGAVENGQIRLRDDVVLPEHTSVYVVVPAAVPEPPPTAVRAASPRLARREQAADFVKQVVGGPADAGQR